MNQAIRTGRWLALCLATLLAITANAQPQIAVTPSSLSASLGPGTTATQALTVTNTGTDALTFSADRGPATAPAGGPDAQGYTWTDSDRPGGPVYQWMDIRATGTLHPLSGVGDVWVDLPFDFPFYGETYDRVKVYADGLLSFYPYYQGSTSNNRPIPYWDRPDLFIAGFWDDLDPGINGAGDVYTGIDDRGRFVVQYQEVAPAGSGTGRYTFQIILDDTGTILIQYGPLTGPTDSATVGIESENSTTGLQVAYNEPYVRDGLAVRIAEGDPWYSVGDTEQTLAPGASTDVPVTFSSFNLTAGTLTSALVLTSDDPGTPTLDVPVSLTVLEAPDVLLSATGIDFGEVHIGAEGVDSLLVTNVGSAPLTVASVATDGPPFSASLSGAPTLAPGESRTVTVLFEPTADGPFTSTLTIATDDPDEPTVTVALAGEGLLAPDIAVSPSSLSASLEVGETTTRTLTISNSGQGDLDFDLDFRAGPGEAVVDSLHYDSGGNTFGTTGWTPWQPFAVANRFTAEGRFHLTAIRTFLNIDYDPTVRFEVYGEGTFGDPTSGPLLWSADVPIPLGPSAMYEVPLGETLTFEDGEDFYIVVATQGEFSPFGTDYSNGGRSYRRTYHGPQWHHETGSVTYVIRALTTTAAALSAEPMAGTVAPGGALDVTVTLDASVLTGGQYESELVVASNDPDEPEVAVPITLDVSGAPGIVLTADSLGFGEVYVGEAASQTFGVRNLGTGPLTVSAVASSDPAFSVSAPGPFTVNPGDTETIEVTFAPSAAGLHEGTITLSSDDPDTPEAAVAVTGEGVDRPMLSVTPGALVVELPTGQTEDRTLTVTNYGPGPLAFSFDDFAGHTPSGGPDGFGYTWIDSDTPGGPMFDWVDISGTGTPLALEDDGYADVDLPFAFPFYGDVKDAIRISANGYLTFGNQRGDIWYNRPIPHNWAPNDFIAVLWDQVDPSAGGTVYYGTDALGRFIVQYDDVTLHSSLNWRATFQAILEPGGSILFQYLAVDGPWGGTVGIENATATVGLEVSYDDFPAYLHDGLAVRIAAVPSWLAAVAPAAGTVAPGESAEVTVSFDATGLDDGAYVSSLTLTSNDPGASPLLVPVALAVMGETDVMPISVTLTPEQAPVVIPASGGSFTYTVMIKNNTDQPRTYQAWTQAIREGGGTTGALVGPAAVTLGPGQQVTRTLTQAVPASTPAGTYTYAAHVGTYPDGSMNRASFPLVKEGTTARSHGRVARSAAGFSSEGWTASYADSGAPAAAGDEWIPEEVAGVPDVSDDPAQASTTTGLPEAFALHAARPNPFADRTTLRYALPESAYVRLVVYDALGRHVATLVDGEQAAGHHEAVWDAAGAAAGVYVYRIEAGDFRQSHTMMRVK